MISMKDVDQCCDSMEDVVAPDSITIEDNVDTLDINTEELEIADYVENITFEDMVADSLDDIVPDSDEEGSELVGIPSLNGTKRRHVRNAIKEENKLSGLGNFIKISGYSPSSLNSSRSLIDGNHTKVMQHESTSDEVDTVILEPSQFSGQRIGKPKQGISDHNNLKKVDTEIKRWDNLEKRGVTNDAFCQEKSSSCRNGTRISCADYSESWEAPEVNALNFVERFLSDNNFDLAENSGIVKANRKNSPLNVTAKGSQTLARKADVNLRQHLGIFDFDWPEEQNCNDYFDKKMDEHIVESPQYSSEKAETGLNAPETYEVGFDTQIAAEAMEALMCSSPPSSEKTSSCMRSFSKKGKMSGRYSMVKCKRRRSACNSLTKSVNRKRDDPMNLSKLERKETNEIHLRSSERFNGPVFVFKRGKRSKLDYSRRFNDPICVFKRKKSFKVKFDIPDNKKAQGIIEQSSKLNSKESTKIISAKETKQAEIDTNIFGIGHLLKLGPWNHPKGKRTWKFVPQTDKSIKPSALSMLAVEEAKENHCKNIMTSKRRSVLSEDNDATIQSVLGRPPSPTILNSKTAGNCVTGLCASGFSNFNAPMIRVESDRGCSSSQSAKSECRDSTLSFDNTKNVELCSSKRFNDPICVFKRRKICKANFEAPVDINRVSSSNQSAKLEFRDSVSSVENTYNVKLDAARHENEESEICNHAELIKKTLSNTSLVKELARLVNDKPLPDLASRESRRRKRADVHVLFSQHLDPNIVNQQKKITSRLGFSVASCCSEATHFISDRFVRTRNMLEAIACGKAVVTHFWLESCCEANSYINEESFILRDAEKEKEIGFTMPVSLAHARQYPLLQNKRVYVTPNVKPDNNLVQSLVKAVHGKVVGKNRVRTKEEDMIILSSANDYSSCVNFLEKGAAVYDSELLLTGIIIQNLQYERHRLFTRLNSE